MKIGTKETTLSSYGNYNNNVPQRLSKGDFIALKNLSKNENIAIQKADKGIDKIDYLNEMENRSDVSKFQRSDLKNDGFEFCCQLRRTGWQ